ncbi:helix-turn-helix domain-containing protein [Spirillospora sp. CA-255316]
MRRARLARAAADDIVALEQARALALRVREMLAHHTRREAELSALFDSARDISRLQDTDAVLAAIVRRARHILRADMAYLALVDHDRNTIHMRVTEGMVAGLIRDTRLPVGTGLGGLVAATGVPAATEDFWGDGRLTHTEEVDAACRSEGIVSIAGAPVANGRRTVGVLYAADRVRRRFTREDLSLLSSLGALAAVALENSRLLEESRTAVRELSQANRVADERTGELEHSLHAHNRLMDIVLAGGGLAEIGIATAELLTGDIRIIDSNGGLLWPTDTPLTFSAGNLTKQGTSGGACLARGSEGRSWWLVPARVQGSVVAVVALAREELEPRAQDILERSAVYTALALLSSRAAEESAQRARGAFIADILSGALRDPVVVRQRAGRVGIDPTAPVTVLTARGGTVDPRPAVARWAQPRGGSVTVHGHYVVVVLPAAAGTDPGKLGRALATALTDDEVPAVVGAAGPAPGAAGLADAYDEASRTAELLLALGRDQGGAQLSDLGLLGVLGVPEAAARAAGFVQRTLGPVLAYDRAHGAALVSTLAAWFVAGRSRSRAAQNLRVHVNTVGQRLQKAGELLGPDWREPERLLALQMALELHPLVAKPPEE